MEDLKKKIEAVENIPVELLQKVNNSEEDNIFSHTEEKTASFSEPFTREGYTPNSGGNEFMKASPYDGQRLNVGALFDSKIAVDLMDVIVPAILLVIITKYTSQKVLKSKLQLTASEKNTLQPVLQNYLNSINFSVDSPLNALLLTVVVIYGSKTIEVIGAEIEKPKMIIVTESKTQDDVSRGKSFTRKEGEKRGRKPKRM